MKLCHVALFASVILTTSALGCGAATTDDIGGSGQGLEVAVEPAHVAVPVGGSTHFAAAVTGSVDLGVRWVVDESEGGTVDASGLYQAPQRAGTFHVRAISLADSSVSGTAQVYVSAGGGGPLAVCATAPLRTTGPVYYYCDCQSGASAGCVAGNDSADGLTPETARRTVANAVTRFNSMPAGATVAFCRGGSFTLAARAQVFNPACRAGNTCDWRDYTPSGMQNAPRPIFHAGGRDFMWAGTAGHDEGYRFWNLDVRHTGGVGVTFWLSADLTDVDVCNVAGSGGDAGAVNNPYSARLTIRNSQFVNYSNQGVIGGGDDITIDSNYFSNAGATRGALYHTVYFGGGGGAGAPPNGFANERITNNEIHVDGCTGTIIVLHGRHVGTVIENNLITARNASGGCYGIAATDGGYPYSSWFRNMAVRRNRLVLAGSAQAITANNCPDCVITDNAIALLTPSMGYAGIIAPDRPARTGTYVDEQTTRAVIRNNSIYVSGRGYGVIAAREGSNFVIENNAVWSDNTTCTNITRTTLRNSNNYCRTAGGAAVGTVFVDAATGDLRPVNPGPLISGGSPTYFSPLALSPFFSPTDAGVARTPPTDIGAFVH